MCYVQLILKRNVWTCHLKCPCPIITETVDCSTSIDCSTPMDLCQWNSCHGRCCVYVGRHILLAADRRRQQPLSAIRLMFSVVTYICQSLTRQWLCCFASLSFINVQHTVCIGHSFLCINLSLHLSELCIGVLSVPQLCNDCLVCSDDMERSYGCHQ